METTQASRDKLVSDLKVVIGVARSFCSLCPLRKSG